MFLPQRADFRAMLRLALPVAVVHVGTMFMGTVDTIMVGQLSPTALASVALGNVYFFGATVFGMGLLMAIDPLVSQAVGAGDEPAIARAIQRSLLLVLGISVVMALLFVPADAVLRIANQEPSIIPLAADYAQISVAGLIPYFGFVVFRESLQAMRRVAPIVWTVLIGNLLNVILNWIFVYGNLGVPPMGVAGSSWATVMSRWAMGIMVFLIARRQLRPYLIPLRPEVFHLMPLIRMIRLGSPIGFQYMLEYGAFAATALLMGGLGTTQIAAHQVAINISSLTFMAMVGVAASSSILVGHAIGAEDEARARRSAVAGLICAVVFMGICALVFRSIPHVIAGMYTLDPDVLALASTLIPIAGVFQVFDGTQVVAVGVLRGAGDTRTPMLVNIIGFWCIGLPLSTFFAFHWGGGAIGLWWGLVAGLAAVAIVLIVRVRLKLRKSLRRLVIDDVTHYREIIAE